MGIVVAILCMSMTAAIGILMLVFACAYEKFQTPKGASWVLFVVIFYILVPVPTIIFTRLQRILFAISKDSEKDSGLNAWAKKYRETVIKTNLVADFILFSIVGIIISSFAFPIVLARASVIKWEAAGVVIVASIFIYGTMAAFFARLDEGHQNETLDWNVNLNAHKKHHHVIYALLRQSGNRSTVP